MREKKLFPTDGKKTDSQCTEIEPHDSFLACNSLRTANQLFAL
jgi:hypothetical protein